MKMRFRNGKIHEVLDLLNEAAHEKKEELYGLLGKKYSHLADALHEKTEEGLDAVNKAKKQFMKTLQQEEERIIEAAKEVDHRAHENPWAFIGTVAFVSFIFGVRFGRGRAYGRDRALTAREEEETKE